MVTKFKITLILIVIFSFNSNAQVLGLRVTGGGMTYFGDLNNVINFDRVHSTVQLGINYELYPKLDIELSYLQGALNAHSKQKNLSFLSKIDQTGITFKYYFTKMSEYDGKLGIYSSLGMGAIRFNPKTFFKGTHIDLQPLKNEGVDYSLIAVESSLGMGISYQINPTFVITGSTTYHQPFTDYIDDVSTRGPAGTLDYYLVSVLGIIYRFGNESDMNSHGSDKGPKFFQ